MNEYCKVTGIEENGECQTTPGPSKTRNAATVPLQVNPGWWTTKLDELLEEMKRAKRRYIESVGDIEKRANESMFNMARRKLYFAKKERNNKFRRTIILQERNKTGSEEDRENQSTPGASKTSNPPTVPLLVLPFWWTTEIDELLEERDRAFFRYIGETDNGPSSIQNELEFTIAAIKAYSAIKKSQEKLKPTLPPEECKVTGIAKDKENQSTPGATKSFDATNNQFTHTLPPEECNVTVIEKDRKNHSTPDATKSFDATNNQFTHTFHTEECNVTVIEEDRKNQSTFEEIKLFDAANNKFCSFKNIASEECNVTDIDEDKENQSTFDAIKSFDATNNKFTKFRNFMKNRNFPPEECNITGIEEDKENKYTIGASKACNDPAVPVIAKSVWRTTEIDELLTEKSRTKRRIESKGDTKIAFTEQYFAINESMNKCRPTFLPEESKVTVIEEDKENQSTPVATTSCNATNNIFRHTSCLPELCKVTGIEEDKDNQSTPDATNSCDAQRSPVNQSNDNNNNNLSGLPKTTRNS